MFLDLFKFNPRAMPCVNLYFLELTYLTFLLFQFNYHEFMEAWRLSVPEGMHVDETHLQVVKMYPSE